MKQRFMSMLCVSVAFGGVSAATAQPAPRVPAAIAREFQEMAAQCRDATGQSGHYPVERMLRGDLNGDGIRDYVMSPQDYDCPGAVSLFAGTAATGTPISVYLVDRAGAATNVWNGGVGDYKIVKVGGRDVLTVQVVCETRGNVPVANWRWCDERLVPGAGGKWKTAKSPD